MPGHGVGWRTNTPSIWRRGAWPSRSYRTVTSTSSVVGGMKEHSGPRTIDSGGRREADNESWLLRTGLSLSVWTLAAVATILAATGQVEFARWAGITDLRAYAVPAVLELVAIAFLLIGYRRARRGDSASMLWFLAAVV